MSFREQLQGGPFRSEIPRKIVVTLGVGGLAYFITDLLSSTSQQNQIWSLIMSVFIGGITLVTQFLLDLENRLTKLEKSQAKHAADVEEQVRVGFSKINEATELFALVEDSALRTDRVIQLVRNSAQISSTTQPLISRFAQNEIGRLSSLLKRLSDSAEVLYEGEDRNWLLSLTGTVADTIDAISLTTVDAVGGLWSSDLGQRYLDAQRDAIVHRGIHIRRVFILDIPELLTDPDFLNTCTLQREMGVEVRILELSAVPGLRRNSLFDFIVFDDSISYEMTAATRTGDRARASVLTTRLELQPERVKHRVQWFTDLWDSAREPD
jgi:uncharacterized protein DUF6879